MENEIKKPKLSEMLRGISQLILNGMFPATHATVIVQAVNALETLAAAEDAREKAQEEAEKPKLEVVTEPDPEKVGEEEVVTEEVTANE